MKVPFVQRCLLRFAVAVVAGSLVLGCSSDISDPNPETGAAAVEETTSSSAGGTGDEAGPTSQTTSTTAATSGGIASETTSVTSPDLEVTLPETEPTEGTFKITTAGSGVVVEIGDTVLLAWEMVAFGTGEVVESTRDFGGPIPIEIGAGFVPDALERAVTGQRVGTQLTVEFPVDMPDLPAIFDPSQAYVLAVEIVDIADASSLLPSPTVPPVADQPTTTATGGPGPLVSADGPLTVSPLAGAPLPVRNSSEIIKTGTGPLVQEGDSVLLDYIIVSWTTGDVVWTTADEFGGPQTIVLGQLDVPRMLESAIFEQPVGSRIQVIYAPALPDLPAELSPDDAYLLAVDISGTN